MSAKKYVILTIILFSCEIGMASDRLCLDVATYIKNNGGCGGEGVGLANPASVYCVELGYEYEIVDGTKGQHGICRFPDGSTADAWAFFEGRAAEEHSLCAQQGCDVETVRDGRSPFSQYCAVCVDREGREIGAVEKLLNLKNKVLKATISPSRLDSLSGPPKKPLLKADLPSSFDWRNYNGGDWTSPVKNQGTCGSCWAFASVGLVEAFFNVHRNNPDLDLDLAEEQLSSDCHTCSCNFQNCCGGSVDLALYYIMQTGLVDEACFPYVDGDGCTCTSEGCSNCNFMSGGMHTCSDATCTEKCSDWASRLTSISEANVVHADNETLKNYLFQYGPVATVLCMASGYFDGDIYRCDQCEWLDHAVLIVGYDDPGQYWIVKNSWGETWNGNGFFKVGYDACGIGQAFFYVDSVNCPYDTDGDGRGDPGHPENVCIDDNCPEVFNPDQSDMDGDGIGFACDPCIDVDNDGFGYFSWLEYTTCPTDNCPELYNPDQNDFDTDSIGDVCDNCTDSDGDFYGDPGFPRNTCPVDNCPEISNPDQADTDNDGTGDVCDNCPNRSNQNQVDTDGDGVGDACDVCPGFDDQSDFDTDNFPDSCDNCPEVPNPGQEDNDGDGIGDACCCVGMVGNVDCSAEDTPDISDITALIDHLYIGHVVLCCPLEADVDLGGSTPDISDITRLIDFLYISHESLLACP